MDNRPGPRATAALRQRDFALLWSGQSVSLAGNGVFTVALPLEVLRLTGSSLDLALIVSARTVPAVVLHPVRRPALPGAPMLDGIREGLRYCRSQPWLWWSMIAVGVANFACYVPLAVLEPLLVRHVFLAGPLALGVLYSASGAGGALASVLAARWPAPRRPVVAIWAAWAGAGLAAVVLGLAPRVWVAVVFAGLTWCGVTYGNIVWFPLMQRNVPADMLGRASSVDWALSLALAPLGTIAAGAAAGLAGVRATLIAGGAVAAATGAVLLNPAVSAMTGSVSPVGRPDAGRELADGAVPGQARPSGSGEDDRGSGTGR